MLRCYDFFLLLLAATHPVLAQSTPPLERLISVDIRRQPVERALEQISRAGALTFSYNPTRVPLATTVSVQLVHAPVREVLNQVLNGSFTYKTRGDHVILLPRTTPVAPQVVVVDGYVVDEKTGAPIARVSLFEKTTLTSAVSNGFGYYGIRLPADVPLLRLEVRKLGYTSKTVTIHSRTSHPLTVQLARVPIARPLLPRPVPSGRAAAVQLQGRLDTTKHPPAVVTAPVLSPTELLSAAVDSTPTSAALLNRTRAGLLRLLTSSQQAVHNVNLSRDTLYRNWQVSLVPYIGTNHRLGGSISNRVSLNALLGYSYAVRALELGGVLNVVRTDVRGVQAAGGGNVVGGTVSGVQLAGLFNLTSRSVDGVQVAGLFNLDPASGPRVQLAGLANVVGRNLTGLQAAGLLNVLGGTGTGWQAAGLLNLASRPVRGVQLAGLVNYAGAGSKDSTLADSVGSAAKARRRLSHVQAAGLCNVAAGDMRGIQAAGLFNAARTVHGVQLAGLVNLADSVDGISIAPLILVRRGYHRLELVNTESWLLNLSLKLGGSATFYTFLTGAYAGFGSGDRRWALGYGTGTELLARRRVSLSLDAAALHVNEENRGWTDALNLHNQVRFLVGFAPRKAGSRFRVVAGPTVSVLVTRRYDAARGQVYSSLLQNRSLWLDGGSPTTRVVGWVGYCVGIRL